MVTSFTFGYAIFGLCLFFGPFGFLCVFDLDAWGNLSRMVDTFSSKFFYAMLQPL